MSFHLAVSDIHDFEIRKLRYRKYLLHGGMITIAVILIGFYAYFYRKACYNNEFYTLNSDNYELWINEVLEPLGRLIWITFVTLAIVFFCVGTFMLERLRLYFKDFFKQFGLNLWIANVLLTLPLTFRAVFDALKSNQAWNDYWYANYYSLAWYNILIFTVGTYIPMLTQISSLIFGFVRNKQVKLMDKNAGIHKDKVNTDDQEENDEDGSQISDDNSGVYSINSNSQKTDNSFFDPPIENYRFYYQQGGQQQQSFGGSLLGKRSGRNQAGFFLRP